MRFPESAIVKRLKVLSSSEAISFYQQWPDLLHQEELVRQQSSLVERTFQETPTRHAFSSVSTELHELKQTVATTNSQLSVITRRTEHFSPSKRDPRRNSSPLFITSQVAPVSRPSQTATPALSFQPPSWPISKPFPVVAPTSTSQLPPTDSNPFIDPTSSPAAARPSPAVFTPTPCPSDLLTPLVVTTSSRIVYHILPLSLPASLEQPPPRTQQDLVLPPCGAFASSFYPAFTTRDCTWQYIFDRVTNPSDLWLSYAPGSLGDYPDIKSLWQAWDEGTFVVDVGRKPAMRLIDARWGNLKSHDTRQGRLPSWRPRNNDKVSTPSYDYLVDVAHINRRPARSGRISFSSFIASRKR